MLVEIPENRFGDVPAAMGVTSSRKSPHAAMLHRAGIFIPSQQGALAVGANLDAHESDFVSRNSVELFTRFRVPDSAGVE
jgi:hypothetical protein